MPCTVRIGPSTTSIQSAIIPDATESSDGVMTKGMVRKLDSLSKGSGAPIFQHASPTVTAQGSRGEEKVAGSMGLTEDGAYVGIITGSATNGPSFGVGIFPFAALRQDGVITEITAPGGSQLLLARRKDPEPGQDSGFGISTPDVPKLGWNFKLASNGGDIDYVITGDALFQVNAVWTKSL